LLIIGLLGAVGIANATPPATTTIDYSTVTGDVMMNSDSGYTLDDCKWMVQNPPSQLGNSFSGTATPKLIVTWSGVSSPTPTAAYGVDVTINEDTMASVQVEHSGWSATATGTADAATITESLSTIGSTGAQDDDVPYSIGLLGAAITSWSFDSDSNVWTGTLSMKTFDISDSTSLSGSGGTLPTAIAEAQAKIQSGNTNGGITEITLDITQ
jgi:hypothetical protein